MPWKSKFCLGRCGPPQKLGLCKRRIILDLGSNLQAEPWHASMLPNGIYMRHLSFLHISYLRSPVSAIQILRLIFSLSTFFLAFKFYSRLFSRLFSPTFISTFFPPLITYACVNGSFRHLGNSNNMSRPNEGVKNAVDNVSFNELI